MDWASTDREEVDVSDRGSSYLRPCFSVSSSSGRVLLNSSTTSQYPIEAGIDAFWVVSRNWIICVMCTILSTGWPVLVSNRVARAQYDAHPPKLSVGV
jgi:hypothetical protein